MALEREKQLLQEALERKVEEEAKNAQTNVLPWKKKSS
jgi:hypothetical protein